MPTIENYKEVRKIQLTGKSTFILSLPKKWMKEMHLDAGDPVTLVHEPATNSVSMISGAGKLSSNILDAATVTITPKEGPETLKRKVVAMYLAGYTTINLRVKSGRISSALREAVRELVRRHLIGTEMIADSSDEITLQVLFSLPELSIETALRRMYLIASAMHKDALLALAEKNIELASGVIRTDDEVDRFSFYISRNLLLALRNRDVLEEIALQDPSDCLSYRIAVKSIERIGDHAAGIAEKCLEIKTLPSEILAKLNKMSELATSVLGEAVEALLQRNYELAEKTIGQSRAIHRLEDDVISYMEKKRDLPHSPLIRLIVEDIRRTAEYASDIAEIAINETIDEIIGKDKSPEEFRRGVIHD